MVGDVRVYTFNFWKDYCSFKLHKNFHQSMRSPQQEHSPQRPGQSMAKRSVYALVSIFDGSEMRRSPVDMGVSKNRGVLPPKMDGENNGKPY